MTVITVDPEVMEVQSRPGTKRSLIWEAIESPEIIEQNGPRPS